MIPDILDMVGDILARKRRINEAANDLITTSPEFAQYEHAVNELKAAVADLRSAVRHIESAQADKIIWQLDGADTSAILVRRRDGNISRNE